MEESALVIIDYDNAIRNGYVQIKESINEMIEEGVNNEEWFCSSDIISQ